MHGSSSWHLYGWTVSSNTFPLNLRLGVFPMNPRSGRIAILERFPEVLEWITLNQLSSDEARMVIRPVPSSI